jgi:hypothetical protein
MSNSSRRSRVPLGPDRIPAQTGVQICRRAVNAFQRRKLLCFPRRQPAGAR